MSQGCWVVVSLGPQQRNISQIESKLERAMDLIKSAKVDNEYLISRIEKGNENGERKLTDFVVNFYTSGSVLRFEAAKSTVLF